MTETLDLTEFLDIKTFSRPSILVRRIVWSVSVHPCWTQSVIVHTYDLVRRCQVLHFPRPFSALLVH